jgi:hypothetical protein
MKKFFSYFQKNGNHFTMKQSSIGKSFAFILLAFLLKLDIGYGVYPQTLYRYMDHDFLLSDGGGDLLISNDMGCAGKEEFVRFLKKGLK